MKKIIYLALFLISGCVAQPTGIPSFASGSPQDSLAQVIEAAAKDPATVCISVTVPQGSIHLTRSNMKNGNVTCTTEGLSIRAPAQ